MDQGALDRPDRGRIGQVVDGGEPEGQGAVAERRHLGRGQGPRGFEGHRNRLRRGCAVTVSAEISDPMTAAATAAGCLEGSEMTESRERPRPVRGGTCAASARMRSRPEGVGLAPRSRRSPGSAPREGGRRRRDGQGRGVDRRPRPPAGTAAGRSGRRRPRRPGRSRSRPRRSAGGLRGRGRRTGGLEEKLARRPRRTGRSSRRRRAPSASGLLGGQRRPGPRRASPPVRSSRASGTVPGRACSARSTAAPPQEWPNPKGCSQSEVVDDREHVGGESGPGEVAVGGTVGATVAPQVEAPAPEPVSEGAGPGGRTGSAQKPVAWTSSRSGPVPAEVVDGDVHTVGRGAPVTDRPGRGPGVALTGSMGTGDGSRAGRAEPRGDEFLAGARGVRLAPESSD